MFQSVTVRDVGGVRAIEIEQYSAKFYDILQCCVEGYLASFPTRKQSLLAHLCNSGRAQQDASVCCAYLLCAQDPNSKNEFSFLLRRSALKTHFVVVTITNGGRHLGALCLLYSDREQFYHARELI